MTEYTENSKLFVKQGPLTVCLQMIPQKYKDMKCTYNYSISKNSLENLIFHDLKAEYNKWVNVPIF